MKRKFDKAKESAARLRVKLRPGGHSHSLTPPDPDVDPLAGRHGYPAPQAAHTGIVQNFLAAARDGSDLCLPLKAALVGAVKIFEICEHTSEVRDQYKQLESRLVHLGAVSGVLSQRRRLDPNLMPGLNNIAELFSRFTACVEAKQARSAVPYMLESQADVADVKNFLLKISARIEAFLYESVVRIEIGVDAILERLPNGKERELGDELKKWRAMSQAIEEALRMRCVHDASHDAQPEEAGCMPSTRVAVLYNIVEWVRNDPKSIFWLAGMAGTGKTSIAISLCRMLREDPDVLLGGTFFCSHTYWDEAKSDVRRIIPTLAALLADQSPCFAAELAAELKHNSGAAAYKPASEQIGPLLQQPLAALASETRPIVFVIDALDECIDERELSALLKSIATFTCHVTVKFILTSRPETHILGSTISDEARHEIYHLDAIDPEDVTEDIRRYIDHQFSQSPLEGTEAWYSDADVRALANLANGLFVHASATIAYTLDTEFVEDRTARLQTLLSVMKHNEVVTGLLDYVYECVITRAWSETLALEPHELAQTQQALACILASHMPLSLNTLAELLGRRADVLRSSLRRLRAVVHIPDDPDQPGLRTLHASFGDYLFERAQPELRIDRSGGDETLVRGCLQVMTKRLHFNISQSRSSFESNPSAKPESITLSLEYACLQWIYHLSRLPETSSLDEEISDIFRPRFLFWLEVISVLGRVQYAATMLAIAAGTTQSKGLSDFFHDANYFIASSQEAIKRSAPHIYLSALPFAAKDSLVYRTFSPLCAGLVSVNTFGIKAHDRHLVMTLTGHDSWVNAIAYSPDGQIFASGSTDGTVRIWDMLTGYQTKLPLESGDGTVNSVAIDPTGSRIASGTDAGTVCLWSLTTGQSTPQRQDRHTDIVWCVVFSPDGLVLASASGDKTVRLCSVETGKESLLLSGHTHGVRTVAFSPSGELLASGSDDYSIRLWSSTGGELVVEPLRGHRGPVNAVCFSPDGTKLASGSDFDNIRMWDAFTGTSVATLSGDPRFIQSIQFSPDGLSLAAAEDSSVNIWSVRGDAVEDPPVVLDGHSGWVCCVRFSPDGRHIASGSSDRTIRIWDTKSCQEAIRPLPAHRGGVNALAVPPDGTCIVSASADRSVRIWEAENGEPRLVSSRWHLAAVSSVAISGDGRLVASASQDRTVRLWEVQTGEVAQPLPRNTELVNAVTFSPDSRWLALGLDDGTVHIWNVSTRQKSTIGPLVCTDSVLTVSFSPNRPFLAAGDRGGGIHIWNARTGQRASNLMANSDSIHTIAFSPNSECIVSGGSDNVVRIWKSATGKEICVLEGHTGPVLSVAYSPAGYLISSGSADGTVRVWDTLACTLSFTLHGHGDWVNSVAFTNKGRSIVSCSTDSTIRVWDVNARSEIASNASAALAFTSLENGWLLGAKGELLLWVPADYRAYVHTSACTTLIGRRRVFITDSPSGQPRGSEWASCWNTDSDAPV